MKINKKRIWSTVLSILMIISLIPQTAFADSVGGNVGGGGSGGMSGTTNYKAWSSSHQGYRFYMIDNNFNRVSDVYDFYFSAPTSVGEVIKETRFDSASSPSGHHNAGISELARLTNQSVSSIPYPVKDNRGHGEEFKSWFLKNMPSYSGGGSTINPGASTSRPSNGSGSSNSGNSGSSNNSSSKPTKGDSSTYPSDINALIRVGKIASNGDMKSLASQLPLDEYKQAVGLVPSAMVMYKVHYETTKSEYLNYLSGEDAVDYTLGKVYTLLGSYDLNYNQKRYILAYLYKYRNSLQTASGGLAYNSNKDLLSVDIPLVKYDDVSTDGCPAMIFLQRSDSIKVAGYESPFIAMVKSGYNLVVEPITWLYVSTGGSNYESYKTYGSYYNIAKKWVSKGGKDSGSFYNSYMGSLGNNCMLVTKDATAANGRVIKSVNSNSKRGVSESVSMLNNGFGLSMHLYSSDMVTGKSGTHTYDSLLGTNPGMAPDPSTLPDEPDKGGKTVTIVKNYVTETNGTEQTDGNYIRKQNPHTIEIEDEPNYKVVDWNTSTNDAPSISNGSKNTWNEVIKTSTKTKAGTSSTTVDLGSPEKVLYVKLKRIDATSDQNVSGDWTLNESELTKSVSTGSKTSDIKAVYTYGALNGCGGHPYEVTIRDAQWRTDGNGNRYCDYGEKKTCTDYCDFNITDNNYTFRRINSLESSYSNIIAKTASFTSEINEIAGNRNGNLDAGQTEVNGFDYKFIIYRGSDKLNTCDYTTSTSVNELFSPATSKTSITRKKTNYTENISISLVDSNSDLDTSSYGKSGHGECGAKTDHATPTNNIDLAGTVAVKVYSGQPRTPDTNLDSTPLKVLTTIPNDKTAGRQVSSGGTISFNPYIRMTYQTLNSGKQDASVLSEYERQIITNDYAEIQWAYKESNLKIISQMFALDADLTKGDKEWNQKNQVLKGGATYKVVTPKSQKVNLTTYQTITEGISRQNSKVTGNELSEASAKGNHEAFVAEAISTFDSTNVKLYVNRNVKAKTAWDNGVAVTNGSDISELKNGSSTASTESKYYLKDDVNNVSNGSRADLDVQEKVTETKYYRFSSDTSGNIYMKSGDSVASVNSDKGERILTKTQDASSLPSGDAKTINLKTGIVDKLVAAIERNTGNDTTASWASSDGHWYNEAYEGVIVMVQKTAVEIKFGAPNSRATVLDPKLIPKLSSTSDQNLTAFLMQYDTDLSESTPISTFKGTEIYMRDANLLFNSNKVYITNSTVQQ